MKVLWASTAIEHLVAIYEYIARDSTRYAQRMVDRITKRTERIGLYPQSGRAVPEFDSEDIREVLESPYRIIYRIHKDRIDIVAVVHGARVLEREERCVLIHGPDINLRPATLADRRAVYEWIACSDLTASMMGPPEFAENPVPTWDEFCADYEPYFFDGSWPGVGRSFIIEHDGDAVGHTNYQINAQPSFAELDIWMRDSSCTGHGWGSDALRMLSDHLHRTLGICEMILRPSARNVRAVRSYEKAGFTQTALSDAEQATLYGPGEYRDTVVMARVFDSALRESR